MYLFSMADGAETAFLIFKREPELVNLLRSPGNNAQPGGPVRKHYLTYRPAKLYIGWRSRILGIDTVPWLLKRLQIRELAGQKGRWGGRGTRLQHSLMICETRSLSYISQKSIPPAYVAWRASTTNRVVVPARQAGKRFLGGGGGGGARGCNIP